MFLDERDYADEGRRCLLRNFRVWMCSVYVILFVQSSLNQWGFFLLRWCGHIISVLSTNLIRYRGPCWFCCRSCLSCSKHPSVMLDVLYICLVGSRATTDTRKEKQSCTGKARHYNMLVQNFFLGGGVGGLSPPSPLPFTIALHIIT